MQQPRSNPTEVQEGVVNPLQFPQQETDADRFCREKAEGIREWSGAFNRHLWPLLKQGLKFLVGCVLLYYTVTYIWSCVGHTVLQARVAARKPPLKECHDHYMGNMPKCDADKFEELYCDDFIKAALAGPFATQMPSVVHLIPAIALQWMSDGVEAIQLMVKWGIFWCSGLFGAGLIAVYIMVTSASPTTITFLCNLLNLVWAVIKWFCSLFTSRIQTPARSVRFAPNPVPVPTTVLSASGYREPAEPPVYDASPSMPHPTAPCIKHEAESDKLQKEISKALRNLLISNKAKPKDGGFSGSRGLNDSVPHVGYDAQSDDD